MNDPHTCPAHMGGPLQTSCKLVFIEGVLAVRLGDFATCRGPNDTVAGGSPNVLFDGMPAARKEDATLHVGVITGGCSTVLIGSLGSGLVVPPGEHPRVTAMRILLHGSKKGRDAFAKFDKYGVGVRFKAGGGSYFDAGSNAMTLDTKEDLRTSSLTFVHEMAHGEYHHEGKGADIRGNKRDYVEGMVGEEVDGAVRAIEAQKELEDAGYDVSGTSFPQQSDYHDAYDDAVAKEKARNPNATPEELDGVGRRAGHERVKDGFYKGEVVTSTNKQPYPDYYGESWQDYHKPNA